MIKAIFIRPNDLREHPHKQNNFNNYNFSKYDARLPEQRQCQMDCENLLAITIHSLYISLLSANRLRVHQIQMAGRVAEPSARTQCQVINCTRQKFIRKTANG